MNHSRNHDPVEQMNAHRTDELLVIAQTVGQVPDATAVRADAVDAAGIEITVETPGGTMRRRVDFLEPINDYPSGIRVAFVRLARHARNQPGQES